MHINDVLMELMSKGAGLPQIIDEATRLLHNPLMVLDKRYRVICASSVRVDIPLWNMATSEQYIADEELAALKHNELLARLAAAPAPIRAPLPNGHESIRMPLLSRGEFWGFIGIYDYLADFDEQSLDGLVSVGRAVMVLLNSDGAMKDFEENTHDIVLGKILACENKAQLAAVSSQYSGTSFGQIMQLMVLAGSLEAPWTRLQDLFHAKLPFHYSTVFQNKLVLLFDRLPSLTASSHDLMKKILTHCGDLRLFVGASFPFSDVRDITVAYHQALYCLDFCQRHEEDRMMSFRDCMMDSVAEICLHAESAEYFIHPIIRCLEKMDKKIREGHLRTLSVFLKHGGDLNATAADLHIHYNTAKYRIGMLESLLNCRLRDNPELLFQLSFSLLVRRTHSSSYQ